jgi:hypothetical protein
MGGWIVMVGELADTEERLVRFRSVFEVPNVPALRVKCSTRLPRFVSYTWAWSDSGVPDVDVAENGSDVLVLHGAVTDLGKYGKISQTREQTASRILEHLGKEGEACIKELNGSFSCVLYRKKSGELEAYTDRFASRPICFTSENAAFLLSNFPSALAAFRTSSARLNPAALWSLFHYSRHVGTNTVYSGIHSLLAGEKLCVTPSGTLRHAQWYNKRYVPEGAIGPSEWAARLSAALKESAARCLRTCSKPYLFLSGGLDSRIAAASLGRSVEAISLCTEVNAEVSIAARVAKSLGVKHMRVVRSPYWYLDTLRSAALIGSGSHFTQHAHFMVPARDLAQRYGDVQFYLGDLLENFNKHYFSCPSGYQPKFNPNSLAEFLHRCVPYALKDVSRVGLYFQPAIRTRMQSRYLEEMADYSNQVRTVSDYDADRFDTLLRWADVSVTPTFNMLSCLHPLAGERNIRYDNELDEVHLHIPHDLRGSGVLHKRILYTFKPALAFIPNANTWLPPIAPNGLGKAAKKIRPVLGRIRRDVIRLLKPDGKPVLSTSGSWLLIHEMYRKDEKMRREVESILLDTRMFPDEIFDNTQIKTSWKEYEAGRIDLGFEINALLSFGVLQGLIPCIGIDL